jgi:hypothetical protein
MINEATCLLLTECVIVDGKGRRNQPLAGKAEDSICKPKDLIRKLPQMMEAQAKDVR